MTSASTSAFFARAVAVVLQVSVGKPCDENHADYLHTNDYVSFPCGTPAGSPAQAAAVNGVGYTQVQLPSVSLRYT